MDEWMVSCRNYSTEIHSNRKPQLSCKLARGRLHLLCHSNRLIFSVVNIYNIEVNPKHVQIKLNW